MRRQLCSSILALLLVGGCSRESDSGSDDSREEESGDRSAMRARSDREPNPGGRKNDRNRYAERNWSKDEEEGPWPDAYRAARTPEEKIAVIGNKQASGPELLAPLIRMALQDSEEQVRIEAVQTLTSFSSLPGVGAGRPVYRGPGGGGAGEQPGEDPSDDSSDDGSSGRDEGESGPDGEEDSGTGESEELRELVDLVMGAVHDPSSEVRILTMEAVVDFPAETQVAIYRRTISAPEYDVRRMTIVELGRLRTKPAFEVLIGGLQHGDPEFRDEVNTEIHLLVNQRFDSFDEAAAWWGENADGFSDNMADFGGR